MYLLEDLPQLFLAVNGVSVGKNTWVSPRPLPSTQAHLHRHRLTGKESPDTVSPWSMPGQLTAGHVRQAGKTVKVGTKVLRTTAPPPPHLSILVAMVTVKAPSVSGR